MNLSFIGLILFLPFVYFEPNIFFPILGEMRVAFVISILTLLIAVVSGARPPKAIQNRLFILLFIIAIISSLISPLPFGSATQLNLGYLYKAIALYFLVSMIIVSKDYLRKFFYVTLGFGFIVSFITLLTVRAGIVGLKGGGLYRMVNYFGGIGDDPNEFGVLLLALLPLPVALIEKEKSYPQKIFITAIALVFILCITRTRSRGAFLGLIIMFSLYLWEKRKNAVAIFIILAIMIFTYFHVHQGYWERISTLQSMDTIESEHNAYTRIMQNQYALELIYLHPITGVGLGNFIQAKIDLLKLSPEDRYAGYVAHNSYLGIAAETGIFGLLIFSLIIMTSIGYCYSSERYFKTRSDLLFFYNMSKAIRIGLIGIAVSIFFLSEQYNQILYQWIAFAVILKSLADKEKTVELPILNHKKDLNIQAKKPIQPLFQ